MSGTYDLSGWLQGHWSDDFYFASPLHWLPDQPEDDVLAVQFRPGRGHCGPVVGLR